MAYFIPKPTQFNITPDLTSNDFVTGLVLNVIDNYTFSIGPGAARDLLSNYVMAVSPLTMPTPNGIVVDTRKLGPNGCYPYSLEEVNAPYNTSYGVYLVANPSGTTSSSINPVISPAIIIATGDNFLPPGYTSYKRIGLICITAGSLVIYRWIQSGKNNERIYTLEQNRQAIPAGTATTFAPVSLSAENRPVPASNGTEVFLSCRFTSVNPGDTLLCDYFPSANTSVVIQTPVAGSTAQTWSMIAGQLPNGDSCIYYQVSPGCVVQINFAGFKDYLGPSVF